LSYLDAIILGVIQGLTEFLPISSSGHLVLTEAALGVKQPGVSFEVILHLGTLFSVLVYFRSRIIALVRSVFAKGMRQERAIIGYLILGTIPAGVVGLVFKDFFERYHAHGMRAYLELVRYAQEAGLLVIGDVKRADIGHSTTQYAKAQLGGMKHANIAAPDAVTVNPYFGYDAIRPFVDIAREAGRGLFVLVQTSNESAAEVQGLTLSDGKTVCQSVGRIVQKWAAGEGLVGGSGYSCIGAVVSPRDLKSTEVIRAAMPNCIFLVPGFGAQGRTADEVARCFKPDGTGAIVNASRSVIYAFQNDSYRDRYGEDWRRCVEQGCRDLVSAILRVVPS